MTLVQPVDFAYFLTPWFRYTSIIAVIVSFAGAYFTERGN